MGARLSTIPENRGPLVTPGNKKTSSNDHWSQNYKPENRAPVCAPSVPATCNPTTNNGLVPKPLTGRGFGGGGGGGGFPLEVANAKEVIALHSSTKWKEYFEAAKQSNKLVVIYFTATWCGPCRYMEPTIKEVAAKYTNVDVVKLDVDELFSVSREYGIQAMPTFLFMKNGKEIDKVVGAQKEDLQRKVEKHKT